METFSIPGKTAQKRDRTIAEINLQREKEWFRRQNVKTCIEVFVTGILASDTLPVYVVLV